MRLFVDGNPVYFGPNEAEISALPDRLAVRTESGTATVVAVRSGDVVLLSYRGRQYRIGGKPSRAATHTPADSGELRAPMPGQIVDLLVAVGASVNKGERILVLEAMKTQQPFVAPFDGTLTQLAVAKGEQVGDGALLAVVEPVVQ